MSISPRCQTGSAVRIGSTVSTRPSRADHPDARARLAAARGARAFQISPMTRTLPLSPCHSTVSPSAPIIASPPVTTRLRLRAHQQAEHQDEERRA